MGGWGEIKVGDLVILKLSLTLSLAVCEFTYLKDSKREDKRNALRKEEKKRDVLWIWGKPTLLGTLVGLRVVAASDRAQLHLNYELLIDFP